MIVAPIGFVSDHMEVLFDLDEEAAERAAALGMRLVRAGTVGTHPAFVAMIRELIEERMTADPGAARPRRPRPQPRRLPGQLLPPRRSPSPCGDGDGITTAAADSLPGAPVVARLRLSRGR